MKNVIFFQRKKITTFKYKWKDHKYKGERFVNHTKIGLKTLIKIS